MPNIADDDSLIPEEFRHLAGPLAAGYVLKVTWRRVREMLHRSGRSVRPGVRLRGPLIRLMHGGRAEPDVRAVAMAIWRHLYLRTAAPTPVYPFHGWGQDVFIWVLTIDNATWTGDETIESLSAEYQDLCDWEHDHDHEDDDWELGGDYEDDEDLDDDDMWADYPGDLLPDNLDYGKDN